MELTVGDWQRLGTLGDFIDVNVLLAGQLPNRNILPSPKLPAHAHVCAGWTAGKSHLDLHLTQNLFQC